MDRSEELKRVITDDPDFVDLPRYGCSLKRVLERYPDGLPTTAMSAKALGITEEEFGVLIDGAMKKLKAWF
jgi:hypothetical protein